MPLPLRHGPRRLATSATAFAAALALAVVVLPATSADAASNRARTDRWWSADQLRTGTFDGTRVSGSALVLSNPTDTLTYTDPYGTAKKTRWQRGTWTSPWVSTGFAFSNLIPSWSAKVPHGTWLRVSARVKSASTTGSWDTVAYWTHGPKSINRASGTSQTDDLTKLAVDTLQANGSRSFDRWQVKVDLLRKPGATHSPKVESISGAAAGYSSRRISTSRTTMTSSKTLAVPSFSQMTHRGHFPQWGGGGEAWCSPTSVSMIVRYFGTGPARSHYSWAGGADGQVDHAARYSYDHRYRGTGNWAFSAAYAGTYGLDSFVTRLYDLREAEAFIKAGIPLVASVAWDRGELTGAPISSSNGHLMVISGFTSDGRVVVNDPAGASNGAVRRTYSRAQFERVWLEASGGVVYVVRPGSKKLPADTLRW